MCSYTVGGISGNSHSEEIIPRVTGAPGSWQREIKDSSFCMSVKMEITHDATVQHDHSEMIVYETMQIDFV